MAYDNTNSGFLSRNERKEKPTHPDFSGNCDINGVQYWISGWTKDGKPGTKMEGKKFFSLSFKAKDARPADTRPGPPPIAPQPMPSKSEETSEIPF